jgi:hypothetical protein
MSGKDKEQGKVDNLEYDLNNVWKLNSEQLVQQKGQDGNFTNAAISGSVG